MTQFVTSTLNDDGTITATDDSNHTWTVHFAGARPTVDQVFDTPVSTAPGPVDDEEDEDADADPEQDEGQHVP